MHSHEDYLLAAIFCGCVGMLAGISIGQFASLLWRSILLLQEQDRRRIDEADPDE